MEMTIWHVGGGGHDFGPLENILKLPGIKFKLYLFDIRSPDESIVESVSEGQIAANIDLYVISTGIAGDTTTREFYLNTFELSSSLLQSSSLTASDNPGFSNWGGIYKDMFTWSQNTEVKETKLVRVASANHLIKEKIAPPPDVLSMDIQGCELEVMKGASEAFKSKILAVLTESEFYEIYARQGLFHEQLAFLEKQSFRFVKFVSFQKWFPGPMVGLGFPTVTESLFIKYLVNKKQLSNTDRIFQLFTDYSSPQLFKIALISFAYNRDSYFYTLMKTIEELDPIYWKQLNDNKSLELYIKSYYIIKNNLSRLQSNPGYFIENPIRVPRNQIFLRKHFFNFSKLFLKIFHLRGLVAATEEYFGWNSRLRELD